MSSIEPPVINRENTFSRDEIIVSKTDLKGRIEYANDVFCRVAEMSTKEVLGQPHSIIRHPDMPRVVFKLLWDTVASGKEIFAYVKNRAKSGAYYWVYAHVTPSFSTDGTIIGYHSNRRTASRSSVQKISPIYAELLRIEQSFANRKEGLNASMQKLASMLTDMGMTYDEFVWSLENQNV